MKIDRLLAITIYLLNHGLVSARTLADKFEVSLRTIQRDIESINLAGIPVRALTGANGGYEILDSFKIHKAAVNMDDYMFVITALKGLYTAYNDKKLDKTINNFLATVSNGVSIRQKIFLDFKVVREGNNTDRYIRLMEEAIDEKKVIAFRYTNADNNTRCWRIEPIALTYKWYSWYVLGFCLDKDDYRLFKLSRMDNLTKEQAAFSRIHKSAELLLVEQENQDRREYYDIKLLCKKNIEKQALEYLKGNVIGKYENGDFILSLHVPKNERMWFSILLGFGKDIAVLEPEELKIRLKEKAIEIISLYEE